MGRAALTVDETPRPTPLQAFRIATREDHLRPFRARSSRRFEPDTCAAADHDDGLPKQFRFAMK
jgi:hypothetical protein